jgi:hypothetical protein
MVSREKKVLLDPQVQLVLQELLVLPEPLDLVVRPELRVNLGLMEMLVLLVLLDPQEQQGLWDLRGQ